MFVVLPYLALKRAELWSICRFKVMHRYFDNAKYAKISTQRVLSSKCLPKMSVSD